MARILFVRDGDNSEGREIAGTYWLSAAKAAKVFNGLKGLYSAALPSPVPMKFGSDRTTAQHVVLAIGPEETGEKRFTKAGFYFFEDIDAAACATRLGFAASTIQDLCKTHTRRERWEL